MEPKQIESFNPELSNNSVLLLISFQPILLAFYFIQPKSWSLLFSKSYLLWYVFLGQKLVQKLLTHTVFSPIKGHVLISEGVLSVRILRHVLIYEKIYNFWELPGHTEFRVQIQGQDNEGYSPKNRDLMFVIQTCTVIKVTRYGLSYCFTRLKFIFQTSNLSKIRH